MPIRLLGAFLFFSSLVFVGTTKSVYANPSNENTTLNQWISSAEPKLSAPVPIVPNQGHHKNVPSNNPMHQPFVMPEVQPKKEAPSSQINPLAKAARQTMATIYQNCAVLDLAPMPQGSSAAMEGMNKGSKGSNKKNGGILRTYSDKEKIIASHYYLKGASEAEAPANACSEGGDVSQTPPIYNYGGKPRLDDDGKLDLLEVSGSGAAGIAGIDCSGFLLTAMAKAGMAISSPQSDWQSASNNIGTSSLMAQEESTNCLDVPNFSKEETPIKAGDVLVWVGHVVMIDSVEGDDPFGIDELVKQKNCAAGDIDPSKMNFKIIQSSPDNGGVGINIMDASEAFNGGPIVEMALAACKSKISNVAETSPARVLNKKEKPSMQIMRHNSEKAECNIEPTSLKYEDCVGECSGASK